MNSFIFKNGVQISRKTVSVFLFFFILHACEKRNIKPLIETFPMTQGSEWHYQRTLLMTVFESDNSDVVVDVDTIQNYYKIWVAKDTVLNDTMYVTRFESSDEESVNQKWQQYYFQDAEGLKLYAYSWSPGPVSFKKSATWPYSGFGLSMTGSLEYLPLGPLDDEIFYLVPPTLSLQLPLEEDSYWTYDRRYSNPDSRIDKKVVGTELLKVGGKEFTCYRVEWLYFNVLEGIDIQINEWIAEEGLIKRIIKYGRKDVTNIDWEYMYNAESEDILQLVDLSLN